MGTCPHCGTANPGDASFCAECGKRMAEPGAGAGMQTISAMETIASLPTRSGRDDHIELAPGEEFASRYVIDRVIGKGGMGVVYRAKDKLIDKVIALKLIRRDRLGGEGAVKRLINEGVTTRDVRHNNVVAVYDVGEADGSPFVSMEYIEAIPLRDWHRKQVQERRDVPLPVAARIIIEVLAGLEAAHAKGVIHRDLKPENILLTEDPTAERAPLKIVDFGIARAAGAAAIESATGTGLGTPRYMAPEQITNADSARESADLYSVSIIFYELLVDVLPQGHWQPPSGGRSDIPMAVDKLIERGLSNRAASRQQSAAEYRQQLEQAIRGYMPQPVNQGTIAPSGSPLNRNLLIGIGGGAVLLVAALGVTLNHMGGPNNGGGGTNGQQQGSSGGAQTGVAALSGTWIDAQAQATYSVQVNPDGSFSGSGTVAGEPASIQGGFQGQMARYVVVAGGMQYPGGLQWDGQCHLNWRTDDGGGGQLHVNHAPGAPCPS